MPSLFDSTEFNERLFLPRLARREVTETPAGAVDLDIVVDGSPDASHAPSNETTVHLRWHGSATDRTTLLFFHGNGETVSDYDSLASNFENAGLNLAVVDYRGYGRSTGTPTLRTAFADAAVVLREVRSRTSGPVVVMGRSLGAACAVDLYARTTSGVAAFVVESGAADLAGLVRRRGIEPPPSFDAADIAAFDPLTKLRRGSAPMLVVHGALDEMIPATEARLAFFAAGAADKELAYIAGRGHQDIMQSPTYWHALGRFIRFRAK